MGDRYSNLTSVCAKYELSYLKVNNISENTLEASSLGESPPPMVRCETAQDVKFGILSVPLGRKSSGNYETHSLDKLDNIKINYH
jgi:hypothetical protein